MPFRHIWRRRFAGLLGLLWLFTVPAPAQVSVSLAPSIHPQFLDSSGKVLSGGFLYTYQAGTTTPLATYTDQSGTIQNANPIPLDATGSPSNLSTQTGIWLSNNSYKICGYNSALVQQWCTDNVSAYQILNNIQNITFGSVTSDPTGAAGELGYRSDIPCFRGYTTFWDCFVTLTGIQTLTNKTLSAPAIQNSSGAQLNSPVINGTVVTGPPATYLVMANDLATGTVLNKLAKINPAGLAGFAILPLISDTGGITGIVTAGAGATGNATIQQNGSASCVFDNAVTSGDYVQISSSVAGDCHDSGATYPTTGQVIGRLLATNIAAGTYLVDLFGPEIKQIPQVVVTAVNLTTQAANIVSTPILTPLANGFYRISCYAVVTQAATTSSTLPTCNLLYTDGDTNVSEPAQAVSSSNNSNTLGLYSLIGNITNSLSFFAKAGVSISYSTTGYASVGGTPMQYALHLRVEGPF